MDENKRLKLIEIGYKVEKCCGLCSHAKFSSPGSLFGDCQVYAYIHLKHSTDVKDLSISAFGSCASFELDPKMAPRLHRFIEFVRP